MSVSSVKKAVSYLIHTEDEDGILNIETIKLIKDGVLVSTSNSISGTFENLLSDTEYVVEVVYSYDLNDGNQPITKSISETIKTKPLEKPTIGFSYDLTIDTLIGDLIVSDIDNNSKIIGVELYNNVTNELIYQTTENDYNFKINPNT